MERKDTTLQFTVIKRPHNFVSNNTDRIFNRLAEHAEIRAS
jgi:hypothetical protein